MDTDRERTERLADEDLLDRAARRLRGPDSRKGLYLGLAATLIAAAFAFALARACGEDPPEPLSPWGERVANLRATYAGTNFWAPAAELWPRIEAHTSSAGEPDPEILTAGYLIARAYSQDAERRPAGTTARDWLARAADCARPLDAGKRNDVALLLAGDHQHAGDLEGASAVLEEALARADDAEHRSAAYLMVRLAELYRARWMWERAGRQLDAAEERIDADEDLRSALQDNVFGIRGMMLLEIGLPEQASEWIELEAELVAGMPAGRRLLSARHKADLLLATDDYQGAAQWLEQQLDSFGEELDEGARASLRLPLALALLRLEQQDGEREQRARELLAELAETPGAHRVHAMLLLAELDRRRGDLSQAAEWLTRAGAASTRQKDGRRQQDGSVGDGWHAALAARLALARDAPEDELAQLGADLEEGYARFLDDWSRAEDPSGVPFLHFDRRRTVVAAMIEVGLRLGGPERALETLVRAQGLGSLARELGGPVVHDVERMRRELCPAGRGLLFVLPELERSHVFVLDAAGVLHAPLAASVELDATRRDLVRRVQQHPALIEEQHRPRVRERLDAACVRLGDALLPPEIRERVAGWSEMTVVGIGTLGYLPFEVLRPGGSVPLGERVALSYVASPTVGFALERRMRSRPTGTDENAFERDLAWLAAPRADESVTEGWKLAALAWDARRAALIEAAYPPERVLSFAEERATRTALSEACAARARVLHIVAHGVYDSSRLRWPAGLVLSPEGGSDGLLWWEDLAGLRLPPLVVISACGAARSRIRRGEDGLHHLGGAMLMRGAGAVVASHGDLDYEATLELMGTFHESLKAGASPARALRDARVRMAGSGRFDHPYYHSLVHVSGLGHEPVF